MKRRYFLRSLSVMSLTPVVMNAKGLNQLASSGNSSGPMPLLFLGHGSPMNAIEDNVFTRGFKSVADRIDKPKAILVVSAHWETRGTMITVNEHPPTIHDFGGFPQELFNVQYPAPGNPRLAKDTAGMIHTTEVGLSEQWGLDHGAWSVIRHMYPEADIPVIQLSLDYTKGPRYHYDLAKELVSLRQKGVLIVGSGNLVHNLRMVAWDKLDELDYGFDWAKEAQEKMNGFILNNNYQALIDYKNQGQAMQLAIPTPDHFLPLLYVLALKNEKDEITIFNDKKVGGSLSMTSLKIG